MQELRSEIEINAPAERVWQVLMDFAHFPEWNPFIRSISGEAREGARLTARLEPPGGMGMTFRPTVLRATPGQEFRWIGHLGVRGLFDGEHIFTIEPLGPDRVRFVQREQFTGVLVPVLMGSLNGPTARGFVAMNEALKARAEQAQ